MLSKTFVPFKRIANFLGVNAAQSFENLLDGEWDPQSYNIVSDPLGGLAMCPGYTAITSATVGASTAWTGFYHFHKSGGTDHYIGGDSAGKLWSFETNQYVNLLTGLTTGFDQRLSFHTVNDICVVLSGSSGTPMKYTGSGSAVTLGGTLVTGDWGLEWQKYSWVHSTVDPRLLYYSTDISDAESGYTSFINFDEDGFPLTGGIKQGDDMVVGKVNRLYRLQYTGSSPFYQKYFIPSTVGPINYWVMRSTFDGKVMFLAPDYQVYMLTGDTLIEIGDNIKPILKEGITTRFQYAVAGLSEARKWYFLSFSYTSSTQNDKTLACDYSRPYLDKFKKLQYPWFVFNFGANCFAEIVSGQRKLVYFGGYVGKMYQYDSGTDFGGSAIVNKYYSKHDSHGDPSIEKKYSKCIIAYRNKGNYDLNVGFTIDRNSNSRKSLTQTMLGGQGVNTLWDNFNWDEDNWADADDTDVGRDIDRVGKLIQTDFGTSGLNYDWAIDYYIIMAKGLSKGVSRTKESA